MTAVSTDPDVQERFAKLFPPSGSPVSGVPFRSAPKFKNVPLYRKESVADAVKAQSNGDLEYVDTSLLHGRQYGVTRPGVAYYLTEAWELTGETYADQAKIANRFPLIYVREDGVHLILAGHHRSTAALLTERKVLAIVVREPWSGSKPSARLVTPRLVIGEVADDDAVGATPAETVADAVSRIRAGERVAVRSNDLVAPALAELSPGTGDGRGGAGVTPSP